MWQLIRPVQMPTPDSSVSLCKKKIGTMTNPWIWQVNSCKKKEPAMQDLPRWTQKIFKGDGGIMWCPWSDWLTADTRWPDSSVGREKFQGAWVWISVHHKFSHLVTHLYIYINVHASFFFLNFIFSNTVLC